MKCDFTDINKIQIHKVGLYSAIPNVVNIFTMPLIGYMIDYLQNNRILTITQVRAIKLSLFYLVADFLRIPNHPDLGS